MGAVLPLTSLNLQTSATLSSLLTRFLCSDTPSTPTHSCGCGPMAMTMGRTPKTTRRSSSWLSTPAMLSSRFELPKEQIIPSGEEMWAGFEVVIDRVQQTIAEEKAKKNL